MLIWTPADGRRGTPDFETDALSDGFAESASSETPDTTPCGPTCADVFMVTHGAADKNRRARRKTTSGARPIARPRPGTE